MHGTSLSDSSSLLVAISFSHLTINHHLLIVTCYDAVIRLWMADYLYPGEQYPSRM